MVFPAMDLPPRPAIIEQVKMTPQQELMANTEKLIAEYKKERDAINADLTKMMSDAKTRPQTIQDFEALERVIKGLGAINIEILNLEGSLIFLRLCITKDIKK